MRGYRKQTRNPVCIYFSDVEAQRAVRALSALAEAVRVAEPQLAQLAVLLTKYGEQVPDADM